MKKTIMLTAIIMLTALTVTFTFSATKSLAEQTVRVEGYASVSGNLSISDLRTSAIDDALSMAVRQVVGVVLDSQSYTVDFELVEKSIITHARGYAKVGKILYETRLPDQYVVGIEALVGIERLKDDISALKIDIMRGGDPRIIVVIPEELLFRRQVSDPAGETEIIRQLTENGFNVVDQTHIGEIRYGTEIEKIIAGDFKRAKQDFGSKADILIVGEAVAERIGDVGGGLISCRARIEVKAVEVGTGRVIISFAAHEAGVDITDVLAGKKAIENAASVISTHLNEKLIGYVSGNSSRYIQVEFENVPDQKTLIAIKNSLANSGGVKMVYLRSNVRHTAVFDLDAKCGADLLAARIENININNMSFSIISIKSGRIEVSANLF